MLAAGTGALLLFGAVQVTMILWGLLSGERLSFLQWSGLIAMRHIPTRPYVPGPRYGSRSTQALRRHPVRDMG
jgi:hypothetical protein